MSKFRRAAKIDKNQPYIVDELRKIPGISVQVGMDDIWYNQSMDIGVSTPLIINILEV